LDLKKKLEEFIVEYTETLAKDKEAFEIEFQEQIKKLNSQVCGLSINKHEFYFDLFQLFFIYRTKSMKI
jgi:hypothetical protein